MGRGVEGREGLGREGWAYCLGGGLGVRKACMRAWGGGVGEGFRAWLSGGGW